MRALLLVVLFLAAPAFAQVSGEQAAAYLEATRLDEPVTAIAEQLTAQITAQAGQFPEPARAEFLTIYQEALDPAALGEALEAYIVREAEPDSLRAVLDWYEEPRVQEMQALELEASEDDEGQVAVQMYAMAGSLGTHEVTDAREAQMDRYLAVTGASTSAVNLYLDIIVASAHSMRAIATEEPPPADSIRAAMRPQLEPQISGAVRGGTLYAFRDVSDADFDAYLALLDEPAAHYANRLGPGAMSAVLVGAITDAGEAFAGRLVELDAAGEIDLDALRRQQGG